MRNKMYVLFKDVDEDQVYAIYADWDDAIADLDAVDNMTAHVVEREVTIHEA